MKEPQYVSVFKSSKGGPSEGITYFLLLLGPVLSWLRTVLELRLDCV